MSNRKIVFINKIATNVYFYKPNDFFKTILLVYKLTKQIFYFLNNKSTKFGFFVKKRQNLASIELSKSKIFLIAENKHTSNRYLIYI